MIKPTANSSFIRVAATVPKVFVGNPDRNAEEIIAATIEAFKNGASFAVFPEMGLTGYTAGDLFGQKLLQDKALGNLFFIAQKLKNLNILLAIGLPIAIEGKLINAAAMIGRGKILGIVPKTYIPGYKEFYEERWFGTAFDIKGREIELNGISIPVGSDLIFKSEGVEAKFALEICEDLWTPLPPSSFSALEGATIIGNLSASNELVGKSEYRQNLVLQQSARIVSGYVYASSGVHESTTDLVFSGHAMIAENGSMLAESKRFMRKNQIIYADIDLDHIKYDREKMTSFFEGLRKTNKEPFRVIETGVMIKPPRTLLRHYSVRPFVPENAKARDMVSEEIINIQAAGLAKRLEASDIRKILLGLSGGLDSTLALLVAVKTFELLGLPKKNILCFTMPGFGTTGRTKSNAVKLAQTLGVSIEEISIGPGVSLQLKEIGHDGKKEDITFENAQARYRTMILMNKANQEGGLVLGTGDLSEIALGWCTFTGDHTSHYNVNAGVPKTLVRYLVEWVRDTMDKGEAQKTLSDILDTPISPELVRNKRGTISQKTEEIIGPYELHDFFLYHFVRWGDSPKKILFLANQAFKGKYAPLTVKKWLGVFTSRFFKNQWKRSNMPDGPKVGSVALSPRGDWRMPSDAEPEIWIKDIER